MDTSALDRSYRQFLQTAGPGGFPPPADTAAWNADQVVASVIAGDRLLAATTAQLIDGGPATYTNAAAFVAPYLDEIGRAAGDWPGLVAHARQCALEFVMLARRLDDAQLATPVQVRVMDADQVRVEGPVPWSGVLATHAEVYLPERVAQLEALRSA